MQYSRMLDACMGPLPACACPSGLPHLTLPLFLTCALVACAPAGPRVVLPACRENNVEQVSLDGLPPGPVSITVRGYSIFGSAGTPQYALAVNGDFRCAAACLGWRSLVCCLVHSGLQLTLPVW